MKELREVLKQLQNKEISIDDAENFLKIDYLHSLDNMAKLDLFRKSRSGIPEVIFSESKSVEMLIHITDQMTQKNGYTLLTRVRLDQFDALDKIYQNNPAFHYEPNYRGKVIYVAKADYQLPPKKGKIGIITAGTSDIPIAEEANLVLKAMGYSTMTTFDVGIAGMHRIFPPLQNMITTEADVIIVCAGMEGTLPGVVSSLVSIPVIGVPTSVGYGIGEKGMGALTTMLQSCSPGLAVVNIDNGFGAATMAALIVKRIYQDQNSN